MTDIFQIVENNGTPKDIGDSKARANIAETFSTSKNYVIGDECLYEGVLYKFTLNHTAGSWNSAHVTSINLADDKVNKSGDTITGNLTAQNSHFIFKNNTMDATASSISSAQYETLTYYDKNSNLTGFVQTYQSVNGVMHTVLGSSRIVNNTGIYNNLTLYLNPDGSRGVSMTEPAIWLNALGLGDSGWTVMTLDSNFEKFNTGYELKYRVIGSVVYARGILKPKQDLSAGTEHYVAQFPSGKRPNTDYYFIGQGSSMNRFTYKINSSGSLYISRYGTTTDSQFPTGAFLTFNFSFPIE